MAATLHPLSGWPPYPTMTKRDIQDALELLQRTYVGAADQDKLFRVIQALKDELARRNKK